MICILICFKNCLSQGILTKFNLCHVYIFHKKGRCPRLEICSKISLPGILFCRSPWVQNDFCRKRTNSHIQEATVSLSTSRIRFYLSVFHIQWQWKVVLPRATRETPEALVLPVAMLLKERNPGIEGDSRFQVFAWKGLSMPSRGLWIYFKYKLSLKRSKVYFYFALHFFSIDESNPTTWNQCHSFSSTPASHPSSDKRLATLKANCIKIFVAKIHHNNWNTFPFLPHFFLLFFSLKKGKDFFFSFV